MPWPRAASPPAASAAKGEGASVTKGVPTAGRVADGAIVEREVGFELAKLHSMNLMLRNPDLTTARRVAEVINAHLQGQSAHAVDPSTVALDLSGQGPRATWSIS